jgi:hypothetical protein
MECLLVEKIAADYWRLRRVLRFESGSIRKILDMAINDYYEKADYFGNKQHKTNDEIDEEIAKCQDNKDKDTQKRVAELERQKIRNKLAEDVVLKVGSLPDSETYEKVIKYEKAIQRSILQNLALLKRL